MIICDYCLRIYKNDANLWVINSFSTIKIFFATDRVAKASGGGTDQNKKAKKFEIL